MIRQELRSKQLLALETVTDAAKLLTPEFDESTDDESDTDGGDDHAELRLLAASMKTDVESLMLLGPCFEEPVPDIILVEEQPATAPVAAPGLEQVFYNRIKAKFPECNDRLVLALGKANFQAVERLKKERESQAQADEPVLHQLGSYVVGTAAKSTINTDSGYGMSVPSSGKLSTLCVPGLSIPAAASSYAPTIMSFGGTGSDRTRIPAQPKDVAIGKNFRCLACGKQVVKSNSVRAWK
jgi:hypothetical protein